jgi:uncharacterized protein YegJ (DUF2314 family)
MLIRKFTLIAVLLSLAACDDQSTRNRAGPDRDGVSTVDSGDKQMNAAIAEARARMAEFLAALKQPRAGRSNFSVKAKYEISGGGEHIWIGDVAFDGSQFSGRVENVPRGIKGMKYGDTVSVARMRSATGSMSRTAD